MLAKDCEGIQSTGNGPGIDMVQIFDGTPSSNPPTGHYFKAVYCIQDATLDFTTLRGTVLTGVQLKAGTYLYVIVKSVQAISISGNAYGIL